MTAYCDDCGLPEKDCICGDDDMSLNAFCPHCLAIWGFDEMQWGRCYSCGYPDNEDDCEDVEEDEPETTGFYYSDSDGHASHVLGDLNMSEETLAALDAMIKAVRKAIEEGEL